MPYIINSVFDYPVQVEITRETDCYYWVKVNSGFYGTRFNKYEVYQDFESTRIEIRRRLIKKLEDSEKYASNLRERIRTIENLKDSE